jgi:hypothetical protein
MTKLGAFAAILGLFAPASAFAAPYTFTTVDVPGAIFGTFARDVNNNGAVAGYYHDGIISAATHGFIFANGAFTTIDEPDAQQGGTVVLGINDSGVVVGTYFTTLGGNHGFMYDGTTFTTIDVSFPTTFGSIATGINNAGAVTGQYFDGTGTHGYVYQGGVFTTVDDPLGAGQTFPYAIGNDGTVAGYYQDSSGTHGFTDVGGAFTTIDNPAADASGTQVFGVNAAGNVSGYYGDGTGNHGFITDGGAFIPLDDPDANTLFGGGIYGPGTLAFGNNDAGQVTGSYLADGDYHGFLATPGRTAVPAPGALALFGLGVLAAFGMRRRATSSSALRPA